MTETNTEPRATETRRAVRLPGTLSAPKSGDVWVSLMHFLFYGSIGSWMPFFNVYLQEVGLSGLQIGTLATTGPIVTILSQPLWGLLADLWGRRRTLLLMLPLSGLAVLGFGWRGGFWFFMGWGLFRALLANPVGPLVDSLTLDYLETKPDRSYGHFRIWGSIGWAVMTYGVGLATTGRDVRLTFVFAATLTFLGWYAALRTPRKLGETVSFGSSWKDAGILLRNRKLVVFLALIMLMQMGMASVGTFYPIYMNDLGASRQLLGLASSLLGLSELPLFFYAAAVVKRIGHTRAIGITCIFFSARVFLYSFISQPALATAVQLLHAPFALYLLASVDYINNQVPKAWRATGQSLFWAVRIGAGGVLGNALAGFLYDRLGIRPMFRLIGLLILGVALAMMLILKESSTHLEHVSEVNDNLS